MEKVYLFYGFGSEYVLQPLFEELRSKEEICIEIDALSEKDSRPQIDALKGKHIVFITSAHLQLNEKNFKHFYSTDAHFYGALEVIQILKPRAAVYIPHDLTQPLIDYEKEFLQEFNLFCSPCEPFTTLYSHYAPTEELGWIKYNKKEESITAKYQAIWFLSDFVLHLKMGVEKSYKFLEPILTQGVSLKFPNWPGAEKYEKYFTSKGIHVYPNKTNTVDLINAHSIILTNGLSSVIAESYFLGKTTINITPVSHYGNQKPYLRSLFPDLTFVDDLQNFKLKKVVISARKPILKPFNIKKMIQLLTNL